jgi:hypothetical protein
VKCYRQFLVTLAAALLFFAGHHAVAGPKPVMVHYLPWFVSRPDSGSWGWHWTMNHFSPDTMSTNGEREIASWYYPLIGPYDSLDPKVLEYHVLLMKLAGIDGVIVDWYGNDNDNDYAINNQRTLALLNYVRKAGLRFSLCYEDQTINQEVKGGLINELNAVAHAGNTMLYAQSNYFNDSSFLRLNGRPVLLNFGPQYFTNSADWTAIFAGLDTANQPAFFTEDNRIAPGAGAFDWPPMWASGGGTNVLTTAELENYLANFDEKSAGWPEFISSAFPRFHDIYAQAGTGASYGCLDDAGGGTLTNTFSRALTNRSALVQLVTWNDFGEGTMIEPTVEFGYRELGTVQNLRRQYLDAAFPYHTNDLTLAYRLYQQRRQNGTNAALMAEMDRVFAGIVSGSLFTANLQITGMETNRLVLYEPTQSDSQLQFFIGGQVANGATVEISTNLLDWRIVQRFAATTNQLIFTTPLNQSVSSFFRAR